MNTSPTHTPHAEASSQKNQPHPSETTRKATAGMADTIDRRSMRTLWQKYLRKVTTSPLSVAVSVLILVFFTAITLMTPLIEPIGLAQNLALGVSPAGSAGHILGTDNLGRDVLFLSLAGTRSALIGPLVIAAGSMLIGLFFGVTAAWRGGLWDSTVSRTCEILLAMPVTLLAIVVAGILGGGYWVTVAVLILLFAPSDIRMVRAATLQQIPKPYIESALLLGIPTRRILAVHIVPNITPIVWANLFLNVAFALVSLSGLSYLGFGVSAQAADWGRQLADGRAFIYQNPAATLIPGILIVLAAAAINIAGDYCALRAEERTKI
ncbi:ABC transporter permease [Schaalia sp. lx-100]|uniref:ABC transporter permease n=1 Tax=Schaalia sp. lx-100 TaxID=2899081 RepID=UPI001E4B87CF|nr:ABC transporter permease [Schaalia sp. lx-100]MCD4556681.1 ABC transporter permease [Schaalia sp. lx-100]